MSYIYTKGSGWYIGFYYQGKQERRSLGLKAFHGRSKINQVMALDIQAEIDRDLKRGLYPTFFSNPRREEISLYQFIEEFEGFLEKQKNRYQQTTRDHYKTSFEHLKAVVTRDIPLSQVDRRLVHKRLLPWLYANYKWNTARGTLIDLRAAFNTAKSWEYIAVNPFDGVNTKRKKTLPEFYTQDEIEIMRKYFARPEIPDWQGDIVFLTLNTGLRREEVAGSKNQPGLHWHHVHLDIEVIKLPGKGRKERLIPLVDDALAILKQRPRDPKNSKVFWEIKSYEAYQTAFYRMRRRTGLGGDIHQLRKTFASHWAMQNRSPYRKFESSRPDQ